MPDMRKLNPYDKYQPVSYDYVAEIPEGWQLLPNIAVFEERIERGFVDEELLSVTIGRGVIRQTDVDIKKDSSNEDKSKYKLIKVGDIAYNRMRMWQGALGYSDYRGITSPAYVILKPKMDINQRFFHYMFRTGFYTNYSKRFSYGIVDDQLSLRYVDFKRMYTILPPLETQNEIVSYLDRKTKKTQEFIQKKERLIELLEEEKKSEITRIVSFGIYENEELTETGIPYYPKSPIKTEIKKLKYLATLKGRIGFHGLQTGDFTESGALLVTGTDFIDNKVNWETCVHVNMERYHEDPYIQLKEGDFLITKDGTIGKTAIVTNLPYEASLNSGVMLVRSLKGEFLNEYFLWVIKSRIFDEFVEVTKTGSTVMHLYQKDFGNFSFPLPTKNVQLEIVDAINLVVQRIENIQGNALSEIEKAKEYQESLITQVVTGQLKVTTPEKILN
jgi:type I restriction enzyme S subunit